MKKKYGVIIGIAMMMGLAGCAKNPEESIIQNKDFDNMIEEAQGSEESVNIQEMSQDVEENYDTYVTTLSDENLHINVNVDAKVEIPATDKLSVYRVKQKKISQELLDKVRTALASDIKLYDGAILDTETKEVLEGEIKYYKEEIQSIEDGTSNIPPEEQESYKEELKESLKELESRYEKAPTTILFEGHESDNMLRVVSESYAENPDSNYYKWLSQLTSEGDEGFYGISDGKNGEYISLYVQNNNDYGNVIRYTKNTIGHTFASSVYVGETSSLDLWNEGEEPTRFDSETEIGCTDKETLNISIDDARKEADAIVADLGFEDFICDNGGRYNEIPDCRYTQDLYYRPVYKFTYLRTIDNTTVSNESGSKHSEEWDGDDYVKKTWSGETIDILVNDTGIVGFYYNSPIEITQTVVDKSQLKSFEEVKNIFEEMVIISYGTDDVSKADGDYKVNIDIDNVVLRYTRISEADNYDSGLLVPVWDFEGSIDDGIYSGKEAKTRSVLTINAIDGSVIDIALGY